MRDGDIFRWSWREGRDAYWCKSRIAVFSDGRLTDTFWSWPNREHEIDPDRVDLKFIANFDGLEPLSEWDLPDYRREDVVDLRHSNSTRADGNLFRRKGTSPCPAVIRANKVAEIVKNQREISFLMERVNRLRQELSRESA